MSVFARRLISALICRQKVVVGVYREISPDGLYLGYCSFGDMRDVAQMRAFHDKTPFVVRVGQIPRSAQKTAKGCTCSYCPLLFICVSGSRCPAITTNAVLLSEHGSGCASRKIPGWVVLSVLPIRGFDGCAANAPLSQEIITRC